MKLKFKLAAAAIASTFVALPTVAQTSGNQGGSPTGGNATGSGQSYSTDSRNDSRDWGWIGLLGLVGLAGLRRKSHDDKYRTNTTGRTA